MKIYLIIAFIIIIVIMLWIYLEKNCIVIRD